MYAGVEKPARDAGKGGEELVGFTGILVKGGRRQKGTEWAKTLNSLF